MSAPPGPQPPQQQPQQQQQPGATPTAPAAPQPQAPAQGGLPPTGVQQQLTSLNAGVVAAQPQPGVATNQGQATPPPASQYGATNLNQMAQRLAQSYGLAVGRGDLVDASGNFLQTPEQLALAGGAKAGYGGVGREMGDVAAKMNYISQALANEQNRLQQQKGIAAIQTGLGQVQKRGRGSLASLQTGLYQDLADLYSNQEYEAADFSYFIQQSQFNMAQSAAHRARKHGKKMARYQMIGSAISGIAGFF